MKIESKLYLFQVIGITITIAVLGTIPALDSNGLNEWYTSLKQPFSPPLWLFGSAQIVYYIICTTALYRLRFSLAAKRQRNIAIALVLLMMVYAEVWNYLFFGLESVSIGFWSLIPFTTLTFIVYYYLRKTETASSKLFTIYLAWLVLIDLPWIFGITQAN